MLAVPLDRAPQSFLERHCGGPPHPLTDLRGIDELAVDLAVGVSRSADVRLDPRARQARDHLDDLSDRVRALAAGVEGLAANLGAVESAGDREVGADGVL